MEFTRLGSTGATVSRLCLGILTYGLETSRRGTLKEAEARPLIKRAVDLRFTFFDTADVYATGASEEITGRERSPIVGANKPEHLDAAVKVLSLHLDEAERKALAEPCRSHAIAGHH